MDGDALTFHATLEAWLNCSTIALTPLGPRDGILTWEVSTADENVSLVVLLGSSNDV